MIKGLNKKLVFGIAVCILVVASKIYYDSLRSPFSIYIGSSQRLSQFNSNKWGNSIEIDYYLRDAMVHDLLTNRVSFGMSWNQIEELIGRPESFRLSSWDEKMEVESFAETFAYKKYGKDLEKTMEIDNESTPYRIMSYYCGFEPSGPSQIVFIVDKNQGLVDVLRTVIN